MEINKIIDRKWNIQQLLLLSFFQISIFVGKFQVINGYGNGN